ncbi:hypothetical protein Hanom_Chr15g01378441 [Helianthus anomalus]
MTKNTFHKRQPKLFKPETHLQRRTEAHTSSHKTISRKRFRLQNTQNCSQNHLHNISITAEFRRTTLQQVINTRQRLLTLLHNHRRRPTPLIRLQHHTIQPRNHIHSHQNRTLLHHFH